MRYRCGGSRTDSGILTLAGVIVGALLQAPPGRCGPSCPPSKPQAPGSALVLSCGCPYSSPRCPAYSGHSPDLRWLCQGLWTPLAPWCPAQAAGGAGIRRHQKQAPVDTVTIHTCEIREKQKPPSAREPRSLDPNHTGSPTCTQTEHAHAHVLTCNNPEHHLLLKRDTHVHMPATSHVQMSSVQTQSTASYSHICGHT